MRLAVDIGGTFTDLIVEDDIGRLWLRKSSTTPNDPAQGVLDVLDVAAADMGIPRRELLGKGEILIHGTTRAHQRDPHRNDRANGVSDDPGPSRRAADPRGRPREVQPSRGLPGSLYPAALDVRIDGTGRIDG